MEMKQLKAKEWAFGTILILLGGFNAALPAGELEPSAPPGATMKTLDEVEPRIPIHQADLPLTISEPGSYYLTEDANCVATAITIEADNVTIDLMGYSLIGHGAAGTYGIYMNGRGNIEVRNGTIRGFGASGICDDNMSYLGKEYRIINIRTILNGGYGIFLVGYAHLVKDCTIGSNGNGGVYIGHNCTVTGNTVFFNQTTGIYSGDGVTVTGNTVFKNQYCGIISGTSCTVIGNTAYLNEDCGIKAFHGCLVSSNTVYENNESDTVDRAGIWVSTRCLVRENAISYNKRNNIYVASNENTIDQNLVTGSTGNGINVAGSGNIVTSNRASGNTPDYSFAAGNAYGQIINVAGVAGFVNTDPTANFRF